MLVETTVLASQSWHIFLRRSVDWTECVVSGCCWSWVKQLTMLRFVFHTFLPLVWFWILFSYINHLLLVIFCRVLF